MKYKAIKTFCLALVFASSCVLAEEKEIKSYDDFPQSGVLAANGALPGGSLALPQLPMGMLGQPIPILGSLSPGKDKQWEFTVSNNSDKPLKIGVAIIQYDLNRNKLSESSYTYKLKAGASADGKAAAPANSTGCVLFLKNWSWNK